MCSECESDEYLLLDGRCIERCVNDNYFYRIAEFKCSEKCESNEYGLAYKGLKICEICEAPCLTCENSKNTCTQCLEPYFLLEQSCVNSCPSGYIEDRSTRFCSKCPSGHVYLNSTCFKCHESCHGCRGPTSDKCTSCAQGFFLLVNRCLSNCPDGYYSDKRNYQCVSCRKECSKCKNDIICIECQKDYFFYDQMCFEKCPISTYQNDQDFTCNSCHFSCNNCVGATEEDCLEDCPISREFQFRDTTNIGLAKGKCLCKAGYFERNSSFCGGI